LEELFFCGCAHGESGSVVWRKVVLNFRLAKS
jgi:hypothetical protein